MGQVLGTASLRPAVHAFVNLPATALIAVWESLRAACDSGNFTVSLRAAVEACMVLGPHMVVEAPLLAKLLPTLMAVLDPRGSGKVQVLELISVLTVISALPPRATVRFLFSCFDFDSSARLHADGIQLLLRCAVVGLSCVSPSIAFAGDDGAVAAASGGSSVRCARVDNAMLRAVAARLFGPPGAARRAQGVNEHELAEWCCTTPDVRFTLDAFGDAFDPADFFASASDDGRASASAAADDDAAPTYSYDGAAARDGSGGDGGGVHGGECSAARARRRREALFERHLAETSHLVRTTRWAYESRAGLIARENAKRVAERGRLRVEVPLLRKEVDALEGTHEPYIAACNALLTAERRLQWLEMRSALLAEKQAALDALIVQSRLPLRVGKRNVARTLLRDMLRPNATMEASPALMDAEQLRSIQWTDAAEGARGQRDGEEGGASAAHRAALVGANVKLAWSYGYSGGDVLAGSRVVVTAGGCSVVCAGGTAAVIRPAAVDASELASVDETTPPHTFNAKTQAFFLQHAGHISCIAVPTAPLADESAPTEDAPPSVAANSDPSARVPGALVVATGEIAPRPAIHVWGANDMRLWSTMRGSHVGGIVALAFGPGRAPRDLFSVDREGLVIVYDWPKATPLFSAGHVLPGIVGTPQLHGLAVIPDTGSFVTCGDGFLTFWEKSATIGANGSAHGAEEAEENRREIAAEGRRQRKIKLPYLYGYPSEFARLNAGIALSVSRNVEDAWPPRSQKQVSFSQRRPIFGAFFTASQYPPDPAGDEAARRPTHFTCCQPLSLPPPSAVARSRKFYLDRNFATTLDPIGVELPSSTRVPPHVAAGTACGLLTVWRGRHLVQYDHAHIGGVSCLARAGAGIATSGGDGKVILWAWEQVKLPRFATGKARIYARARATQQPGGMRLEPQRTIEVFTFGSQIPAVHSICWYDPHAESAAAAAARDAADRALTKEARVAALASNSVLFGRIVIGTRASELYEIDVKSATDANRGPQMNGHYAKAWLDGAAPHASSSSSVAAKTPSPRGGAAARLSSSSASAVVPTTSVHRSHSFAKMTDQGAVKALACHPTLPIAVSGGDDGVVRLWDLDVRKCVLSVSVAAPVRAALFYDEGDIIVIGLGPGGSKSGAWCALRRDTLTLAYESRAGTAAISALACCSRATARSTVKQCPHFRRMRIKQGRMRKHGRELTIEIGEPPTLAVGDLAGQVRLYAELDAFDEHDALVRGVKWQLVRCVDGRRGAPTSVGVRAIDFSMQGWYVRADVASDVAASAGRFEFRLWEAQTGDAGSEVVSNAEDPTWTSATCFSSSDEAHKMRGTAHQPPLYRLVASRCGTYFAAGDAGGGVVLARRGELSARRRFAGHSGRGGCVAVAFAVPSKRPGASAAYRETLLSAGEDGCLFQWDLNVDAAAEAMYAGTKLAGAGKPEETTALVTAKKSKGGKRGSAKREAAGGEEVEAKVKSSATSVRRQALIHKVNAAEKARIEAEARAQEALDRNHQTLGECEVDLAWHNANNKTLKVQLMANGSDFALANAFEESERDVEKFTTLKRTLEGQLQSLIVGVRGPGTQVDRTQKKEAKARQALAAEIEREESTTVRGMAFAHLTNAVLANLAHERGFVASKVLPTHADREETWLAGHGSASAALCASFRHVQPGAVDACADACEDEILPTPSLMLEYATGFNGAVPGNATYTPAKNVSYTTARVAVVMTQKNAAGESGEGDMSPRSRLDVADQDAMQQQRICTIHGGEITCMATTDALDLVATGERRDRPAIHVWSIDESLVSGVRSDEVFGEGGGGAKGTGGGGACCLATLRGFHAVAITRLAFSRDKKLLVTAGADPHFTVAFYLWRQQQVLWHVATGEPVLCLAVYPDCSAVVQGGTHHINFMKFEGTGQNVDVTTADLGTTGKQQPFLSCGFVGSDPVVGTADGSLYRLQDGKLFDAVDAHRGAVTALAPAPHRQGLVSGGADWKVKLWSTGLVQQWELALPAPPAHLPLAVTRTATVYNLEVYTCLAVTSLCCSSDGDLLVGTTANQLLEFPDYIGRQASMRPGQLTGVSVLAEQIPTLAFASHPSRDSPRFLRLLRNGRLELWGLRQCNCLCSVTVLNSVETLENSDDDSFDYDVEEEGDAAKAAAAAKKKNAAAAAAKKKKELAAAGGLSPTSPARQARDAEECAVICWSNCAAHVAVSRGAILSLLDYGAGSASPPGSPANSPRTSPRGRRAPKGTYRAPPTLRYTSSTIDVGAIITALAFSHSGGNGSDGGDDFSTAASTALTARGELLLAAADSNGEVRLFSPFTGDLIARVRGRGGLVNPSIESVSFCANGVVMEAHESAVDMAMWKRERARIHLLETHEAKDVRREGIVRVYTAMGKSAREAEKEVQLILASHQLEDWERFNAYLVDRRPPIRALAESLQAIVEAEVNLKEMTRLARLGGDNEDHIVYIERNLRDMAAAVVRGAQASATVSDDVALALGESMAALCEACDDLQRTTKRRPSAVDLQEQETEGAPTEPQLRTLDDAVARVRELAHSLRSGGADAAATSVREWGPCAALVVTALRLAERAECARAHFVERHPGQSRALLGDSRVEPERVQGVRALFSLEADSRFQHGHLAPSEVTATSFATERQGHSQLVTAAQRSSCGTWLLSTSAGGEVLQWRFCGGEEPFAADSASRTLKVPTISMLQDAALASSGIALTTARLALADIVERVLAQVAGIAPRHTSGRTANWSRAKRASLAAARAAAEGKDHVVTEDSNEASAGDELSETDDEEANILSVVKGFDRTSEFARPPALPFCRVQGHNGTAVRYSCGGNVIFAAGALGVSHVRGSNTQRIFTRHQSTVTCVDVGIGGRYVVSGDSADTMPAGVVGREASLLGEVLHGLDEEGLDLWPASSLRIWDADSGRQLVALKCRRRVFAVAFSPTTDAVAAIISAAQPEWVAPNEWADSSAVLALWQASNATWAQAQFNMMAPLSEMRWRPSQTVAPVVVFTGWPDFPIATLTPEAATTTARVPLKSTVDTAVDGVSETSTASKDDGALAVESESLRMRFWGVSGRNAWSVAPRSPSESEAEASAAGGTHAMCAARVVVVDTNEYGDERSKSYLISGDGAGALNVWVRGGLSVARVENAHNSGAGISALYSSHRGNRLCSAASDMSIALWRCTSDPLAPLTALRTLTLGGVASPLSSVCWEGQLILVGTANGGVVEMSCICAQTTTLLDGAQRHFAVARDARDVSATPSAVAADVPRGASRRFALADSECGLQIWSRASLLRSTRLKAAASALCFWPRGELLAVGYGASGGGNFKRKDRFVGGVALLDACSLAVLCETHDSNVPVAALAVAPSATGDDGGVVAMVTENHVLHLYSAAVDAAGSFVLALNAVLPLEVPVDDAVAEVEQQQQQQGAMEGGAALELAERSALAALSPPLALEFGDHNNELRCVYADDAVHPEIVINIRDAKAPRVMGRQLAAKRIPLVCRANFCATAHGGEARVAAQAWTNGRGAAVSVGANGVVVEWG